MIPQPFERTFTVRQITRIEWALSREITRLTDALSHAEKRTDGTYVSSLDQYYADELQDDLDLMHVLRTGSQPSDRQG